MDAGNLRIKRVIVEVKYNAVLAYLKLREELFDKWLNDFTRIDLADTTIQVIDERSKFKVFSEWNRSGLYFEDVEKEDDYIRKTNEYLKKLLDHYKRNELRRIGNRFEFILPYESSFEELFKILKANIYKEKIDQLGEIVDIGTFALTAKDSDYKINISLGPVRKHEITRKNEFKFDDDPENALLIDFDYYNDVKKEYDVEKFMQDAWKCAYNRCKLFIQNISKGE